MSSLKAVKDAIFPTLVSWVLTPFVTPSFCATSALHAFYTKYSLYDVNHWFIGILKNAEGRPPNGSL